VEACTLPAGYSDSDSDCDDSDASVNPGASETCNGIDDDCNTLIDDGVLTTYFEDADGDGFGNPGSTQDACAPPTGFVADNADCDDADSAIYPGAVEICDGVDNDCNSMIDDACIDECSIVLTGDINESGTLTSADIIAMVNFVFKSGATPAPCEAAADVNCSETITSADIIFMVNHVFKSGPLPCDACTLVPSVFSCP
jgi:hypothetical protein